MSPLSVIVLEFDPILRLGEIEMRLETAALAVVIAISLAAAGLIARATPAGASANAPDATGTSGRADGSGAVGASGAVQAPGRAEAAGRRATLRGDDLLFVAMGALPGAIAGGRLGYVLLHLDYYSAHQTAIFDPAQGSLELTLAVVGGTLTALYVLRLLGAPVGRWAHVAIFPLLLALGTGKIVSVLGADGQGVPSDLPWATMYVSEGPWGSLGPDVPSHPSQVYEGIATLLILQLMTVLVARGPLGRPDGTAFVMGLALWATVRVLVASTWRDPPVLGPLLAEQLIAGAVVAACGVLLLVRRYRRRPRGAPIEMAGSIT